MHSPNLLRKSRKYEILPRFSIPIHLKALGVGNEVNELKSEKCAGIVPYLLPKFDIGRTPNSDD